MNIILRKRRPQQNNKKYINLQSEGSTHKGWECKDDMKLVFYDDPTVKLGLLPWTKSSDRLFDDFAKKE